MVVARDPRVVVCPELPRWPETEALLRAGLDEQAAEALAVFHERFGTNRRCHLSFARAQAVLAESRGEYERAQSCLQEAIAEAQALGLPGERWQAEAALGNVYLRCREQELATQAFARAAASVEELAATISNTALREQFLGSPPVQSLWQHRKQAGTPGW